MAGSGTSTTYTSSADYHDTVLNDYNDNVIVPKSILIDTADAIRGKRDGSTQITVDTDPVSGENYISSSGGITPIDFATEISALTTGGNSFTSTDFRTQTYKRLQETGSVSQSKMKWYGDYRKVAYMTLSGSKTSSNAMQHIIYIYVPYCLNYKYTYNNKILVPLINISTSGQAGNQYIYQYGPNTSYNTNMSDSSNQATILWNDLEASKNGSDDTQYTATIYSHYGNTGDSSVWLPYYGSRVILYYPSATNKIVLE